MSVFIERRTILDEIAMNELSSSGITFRLKTSFPGRKKYKENMKL
jgi:hypothetical protein